MAMRDFGALKLEVGLGKGLGGVERGWGRVGEGFGMGLGKGLGRVGEDLGPV